jgi:hypothetical protein
MTLLGDIVPINSLGTESASSNEVWSKFGDALKSFCVPRQSRCSMPNERALKANVYGSFLWVLNHNQLLPLMLKQCGPSTHYPMSFYYSSEQLNRERTCAVSLTR